LSNPLPLPSLEEIEKMERQRSQAIESLEISGNSVKCQKCGVAVPIVGKLTMNTSSSGNARIVTLQLRLKWLERHYKTLPNREQDIQSIKQELQLLEYDAQYDKLRTISLHSSKIIYLSEALPAYSPGTPNI
jgi:hypothetical protein